jgi:hypothetical protein
MPTILLSQELPEIRTNITPEESEKSQMKIEFADKYDQILSFTRESYWNSQKIYILFGRTNGKWERIKWTLKLDKDKNIIRTKIRKMSFMKDEFQELLTFFDTQNFWTFELDSLNLHEEVGDDGSSTLWTKTDGTTDSFEVLRNGQHRQLSSYEAEYFQELIPVEQRRKFIECRNKFWSLNKLK